MPDKKNLPKEKKKHIFLKLLILILLLPIAAFGYMYFTAEGIVPERDSQQFADIVNVLLIGADYNEVGISEGRSDCIMLLSVNTESRKSLLLSIPRDTYTEVKGHGKTKINHAYAYGGVALLRDTVEELLDIPIDYYAAVNFAGFEQIIDAMGGIDIEVDKDMDVHTYYDHIKLEAGYQHLDGKQALQFVRFRRDDMGDIRRVERQQLFIQAVAEKMLSFDGIKSLPQLISTAFDIVQSDMSKTQMISLGLCALRSGITELDSATLPGYFKDVGNVSGYWGINEEKANALLQEYGLR